MEKLVIIGTGGLAGEIVDFIERYQLFEVAGFTVNEAYMKDSTYMGRPVFPIESLEKHYGTDEVLLFSSVSWYNYLNRVRKEKYDELKAKGYSFANLVSPHAMIYTEDIGEGNWFHDFAHVGYGVTIGNNNIIRMHTTVSHYTILGDHNTLTSGTRIGGHVICGDCSFFGLNSTVFNRVRIGNKCVVGGGAVVKEDLDDFSLCVSSNSFVKQCSETKIEEYISPRHVKRTVEEFNEIKDRK